MPAPQSNSHDGSGTKGNTSQSGEWDVIYSYTRAQAIEDGVLVDVSETAKEAGFRWPVAMTCEVWADCVAWGEEDTERTGALQDEAGRLWDVVSMAAMAARRGPSEDPTRVPFKLLRVHGWSSDGVAREVELVGHVGPGDAGEPVITIMLPGQD